MVDLAIGGLVCRGLVEQQGVPGETDVPLAALGIEDPERRPAARWPVPVVGDERLGALAHDVALFGRPWGFELADVRAPVRWWHGDADTFVPLAHAEATVAKLPDCELHIRPGESHLGGFAAADEVLQTLDALRGQNVR